MGKQTGPIDIYARVSRKGDRRQRSVSGQIDRCRIILADRDLTPGEVLKDDGKSAWRTGVKRPDWDGLMARLASGASGGVIVYDLSRFSRRPIEGERLIEAAERGLIVLDSESTYDLTTANGKKAFRDQLNSAAFYSDDLSRKVRHGKLDKARAGEPSCSSRPFGFQPGGIEHHPDEAPVLREMTARLLAGESQLSLMADLAARGITTSYGKPWTYTGLRAVLLRPLNAGLVEHKGKIVASTGTEPLISRADHDMITAMFAARRRGRPPSPKYLCSGVAVCGKCGQRLHGRPRSELRKYPDGEVRREYWCGPKPGGCMKIAIDQRALDELAAALAIEILSDPKHAEQIERAAAERADEAAKLDAEIAEAEGLATALAGRLGRLEITLDRYDTITGPLDARLAALRAARTALTEPGEPIPAAASRAQWQARWTAAKPAERRHLLRTALRGRVLVVGPADPADRADVTRRVDLAAQQP